MQYITIQNKKIPLLGYGTWQLTGKECEHGLAKALEIGYRHIDTAQIYENEAEVGSAIATSGVKRDDIFLTTKVWISELDERKMQKSVDASLKKLKTDYVDLLLIHWPTEAVPFFDQMRVLTLVQKEGKARMIGVSNYTVAQMKECVEKLHAPIINNQVEYHPYLSQKKVIDYAAAHGMFITAYCPLARGRIMGDPVLTRIAEKHGKTVGQITLRWLVQQNIAAIPKAASEKHIRENFDIFNFALDAAEMKDIHALARPDGRIVNPEIAPEWDKAA